MSGAGAQGRRRRRASSPSGLERDTEHFGRFETENIVTFALKFHFGRHVENEPHGASAHGLQV